MIIRFYAYEFPSQNFHEYFNNTPLHPSQEGNYGMKILI